MTPRLDMTLRDRQVHLFTDIVKGSLGNVLPLYLILYWVYTIMPTYCINIVLLETCDGFPLTWRYNDANIEVSGVSYKIGEKMFLLRFGT